MNILTGGLGNDSYVVYTAATQVIEQANQGTDLIFSAVSYTLPSNVENLALLGTANLTATGNSLNNVIFGNSGTDTLIGGLGNDAYVTYNTTTQVIEQANQGTDVLFSFVSYTLPANVEKMQLLGSANLTATGNSLDNVIFGNSGADTLIGGLGNDAYVVHNAGTQVIEQPNQGTDLVFAEVSYILPANVENLQLQGSANLDGTGNALDNVIFGNIGNNMLTGAGGSDIFVFRPSFGQDTITDFDVLNDYLYFDLTIFSDIADVLAHTADNGVITDDLGNILTLTGVTKADLQAHTDVFFFT